MTTCGVCNVVALTIALLLSISLNINLPTVNAGYLKCRRENGPIPIALRCDNFDNAGNARDLDNQATDQLNTAVNTETPEMTAARLSIGSDTTTASSSNSRIFSSLFNGIEQNENAFIFGNTNDNELYTPTFDAYCFNEDYPVPSLASIDEQIALYLDYKAVFDAAFDNANVLVSQNRIPGMFLRMCFHDNAINVEDTDIDFRTYVANAIDPDTKKWTAESQFMITSGADASNLICPSERTHPNNNVDQTATKVLTHIQRSGTLKAKHPDMSYADLLHNGCNAATIYLTSTDPTTALTSNPFTFGRKDACHIDVKCGKKYELCGPSELLPGVNLNVNAVSDWFTSRGMNVCSMMALMWTHTTVQDMDFACPIQKLICTATQGDVDDFGNQNRYFNAGDALDYFDFFLNRGTHSPGGGGGGGGGGRRGSCDWTVNGNDVTWPMTQIDCTFGLSNVESVTGSSSALTNVIKNFVHNSTYYNRYDILQCALNQLGGTGVGTTDNANNACAKVLPTECKAETEHMFGSFYSSLPATTAPRSTVDHNCERFGYRRHRSLHLASIDDKNHDSPTEYVMNAHSDCLDVSYDMYLIIDGVHFIMLTTPADNSETQFCPPLMIHSVYDDAVGRSSEMEKVMVVFPADVVTMNDEMKFHLGIRTLDDILETYDAVNVGYGNSESHIIYHPVTNNCVALLQNMAKTLNVPLRDNVTLQEFITNRLLLSLSSNSEQTKDLFEQMMKEYEMEAEDGALHRLLSTPSSTTRNSKELISKLLDYYML